ncbi:response regulator [Bdellovibrio sp. BCCA]|nr:response regulator [uncultured Bdellovibrio sp.]
MKNQTELSVKENPRFTSPLFNQRILVIDDSEDTLALLQHRLKKFGAQVTSCLDPKEALKTAQEKDFDVIISDIGMPDLNGYDLMKIYRAWEKRHDKNKTPAIALTAYTTEEDARKALEAGFQVHMTKPMNIKVLEKEIETLIGEGK